MMEDSHETAGEWHKWGARCHKMRIKGVENAVRCHKTGTKILGNGLKHATNVVKWPETVGDSKKE